MPTTLFAPYAASSGDTNARGIEIRGNAAALNEDCVSSVDCFGFTSAAVQLTGTWAGTFTFQGSNDNLNWVSCAAIGVDSVTGAPVTTTTVNGLYFIPLVTRYMRVRKTVHTSGTTSAAVLLYTNTGTPLTVGGSIAISGVPSIRLSADASQGAGTLHHRIAQATNVVSVKTSAGNISSLSVSNRHATLDLYFKLYNSATAPTLGVGTPVQVWRVRPNTDRDIDMGPFGIRCSTGIAYALTSDLADTGVTNVAASDVLVTMSFT